MNPQGRWRLRGLLAVPLHALLLVAVAALFSCSKSTPTEATPEPSARAATSAEPSGMPRSVRVDPALLEDGRVRVEAVARRVLAEEVLASAEVVPSVDGMAVIGAMVSGRISRVLVREGEVVRKGQVLAWIDAPEAARMQGDYLRARARLWRAQQNLDREGKLWSDKATSERAVKDAESEVREARADEAAALGLLESAHVPVPSDDARRATARIGLHSPIAGVVSKRNGVVGAPVGLGDSLFEVIDPSRLTVRADVPEAAARRVRAGTKALVLARGINEGCNGKVRSKLEAIDSVKRTMGVLVEVDTPCEGLVAGGFADVTLTLSAAPDAASLVVPRTAVVDLDGATAVFVLNRAAEGSTFDVRTVRLGLSDGNHVMVEEGLREGDQVAVVGAFLLKGERMKEALGGE